MKLLRTLFLLPFMLAVPAFAQTGFIYSVNIVLPPNPDPIIATWGTGASVFSISANTTGAVAGRPTPADSRVLVLIKKKGTATKVCGSHTAASAPAADFKTGTKTWSGKEAVALLGGECQLSPGDYDLSVQFFSGSKNVALSEEVTKAFSISSAAINKRTDVTIIKERPGEPTNKTQTPVIIKERPGEPTKK